MPCDIQVHRQVPLNNLNILEETKLASWKLLNKFDSIISQSNNNIGQTDLSEMHIAMRPDSTPGSARPYPLTLKYHDFLKQEIKTLLDVGIICKSMSPWASPIIVVKKHTPEGSPQQFRLCIDYRKLHSLLPSVTPATGTKKVLLLACPYLK